MNGILRKSLIPVIFIVFSVIYLYGILNIDDSFDEGFFGIKFIPFVVFFLLILFSLIDLYKSKSSDAKFEIENIKFKSVFLVSLSTLTYVFIFDVVGYVIATPFYVLALCYCFKEERFNIFYCLIVSLLTTFAFYMLFSFVFSVRLPSISWGM